MHDRHEIVLKNGELMPQSLVLHNNSENLDGPATVILKIHNTQSEFFTDPSKTRKYIFFIEELDFETPLMGNGEQFQLDCLRDCSPGVYHLVCINYPKIQCEICIEACDSTISPERKSNTVINLAGLEAVEEEKQEQLKEDMIKEGSECAPQSESADLDPFGTPKKAQLSDYDHLLTSPEVPEESLEKRCLRYFQEEFKLWRNFFQENAQTKAQTSVKEKPKSEQHKNSDVQEGEATENWSKMLNYSPDQNCTMTMSCGSPQNYENLSECSKEKSVASLLYSHRGTSDLMDEEIRQQKKTMKKTNSQYKLNIVDMNELYETEGTSSKANTNKKSGESFGEWLSFWSENKQVVKVPIKNDGPLIKQWLTHLKNKHKIARFVHE